VDANGVFTMDVDLHTFALQLDETNPDHQSTFNGNMQVTLTMAVEDETIFAGSILL
jgi:hypothetical protein